MKFHEKILSDYQDKTGFDVDSAIVADFYARFLVMLEWRKAKDHGVLTHRKFGKQILALRAIWNNVAKYRTLDERAWNRMYAKQICPLRAEMFPDEEAERQLQRIMKSETPRDIDLSQVDNRARTFSEYS